MAASLRTDSPLSTRIVLSFLDFLNTVEVAPGVDKEGLEVASQCLSDVFGLDSRQAEAQVKPNLLTDLFRSAGLDPDNSHSPQVARKGGTESSSEILSGSFATAFSGNGSDGASEDLSGRTSSNSNFPVVARKVSTDSRSEVLPATFATAPSTSGSDGAREELGGRPIGDASTTSSLERLFEQFREGLESAGHFDGFSKGSSEYLERLSKARTSFQETVKKLNPSSLSVAEPPILAEAFKVQGNSAMALSHYAEAIDLYTLAISLCGDNAVYYSNRAAAHTQVGKYEEAIGDCNKAIQADPNYSKAYSRLGLAYYAQGKYHEAIEKGFRKAHMLDPTSKAILENLQAAQQKLEEEQHRSRQQHAEQNQRPENSYTPRGQSFEQGFGASFPFNGQLPPEMENLFPGIMNLAAQFGSRDPHAQEEPRRDDSDNQNVDGQPEVRMDGNINLTFEGDQMPPQVAGFVQSMLQMFAGSHGQQEAAQENNQTEGNQGRRE